MMILGGFVAHATFFHLYVDAVPFACRGHVLQPRFVGSRFFFFLIHADEVVCFT